MSWIYFHLTRNNRNNEGVLVDCIWLIDSFGIVLNSALCKFLMDGYLMQLSAVAKSILGVSKIFRGLNSRKYNEQEQWQASRRRLRRQTWVYGQSIKLGLAFLVLNLDGLKIKIWTIHLRYKHIFIKVLHTSRCLRPYPPPWIITRFSTMEMTT